MTMMIINPCNFSSQIHTGGSWI